MKNFLKGAALLVAVVLGASTAFAEHSDEEVYGFAMLSHLKSDSALNIDDGLGLHVGLGKAFNDRWNIEGYFQSASTGDAPRLSSLALGTDLQFSFNQHGRFKPYLFGGVGLQSTRLTGLATDQHAVVSGGVGFRASFEGTRASLRGEFRHRAYEVQSLSLDDQLFSIGIHMPFGGDDMPAPAPVVEAVGDADGDGVTDDIDRCPDTASGVAVDSYGCARDSDGDGVADYMDECPDTVSGAVVNDKGCEMDGDNDGVVDRLDECPDSAEGVQVDIKGCEIKEEIRLPGVNFESNSDRLVPGAESVLYDAAATLDKNPSIKVEVAGHTDSDGAADYNESLSARRAATVRDFLISRGIAEDRMTARGYGESQPVADNSTAAGKAQNRRVVLRITER